MANSDAMGGWALGKFLAIWNRHPLSIFIILPFITLMFVFMVINNRISPTDAITLTGWTYGFVLLILAAILLTLCYKRKALYNVLDLLDEYFKMRSHVLQEDLRKIEIGVGEPYVEMLEWLCPKKAKSPITQQTHKQAQFLESLIHIMDECDINIPIDLRTYHALAKYYYKTGEFQEALEHIDKAIKIKGTSTNPNDNDICESEIYFCKALILIGLDRKEESQQLFAKASGLNHVKAKCWKCLTSVDLDEKRLDEFISEADNCEKSTNTVYCQNKLSTAYYIKAARYSDGNENKRRENLIKAIELTDVVINKFDSWVAYFNKACDLSMMAQYDICFDESESYDNPKVKGEMEQRILFCLKKAFEKMPILIRYSLEETDLKWVKENCAEKYYELIGKTYEKIGRAL